MRLADLNAKFWGATDTGWPLVNPDGQRHGLGVTFECPGTCCAGKETRQRIAVAFLNPIDGGPMPKDQRRGWKRTGDTIETLTLTPSINAHDVELVDADGNVTAEKWGHWHGFITNGAIA